MKLAVFALLITLMLVFAAPALAAPASPAAPGSGLEYDPVAEYFSGITVQNTLWQTGTVTIDTTSAAGVLTDLGVMGVVTLGALIFVAGKLYRKFRG